MAVEETQGMPEERCTKGLALDGAAEAPVSVGIVDVTQKPVTAVVGASHPPQRP